MVKMLVGEGYVWATRPTLSISKIRRAQIHIPTLPLTSCAILTGFKKCYLRSSKLQIFRQQKGELFLPPESLIPPESTTPTLIQNVEYTRCLSAAEKLPWYASSFTETIQESISKQRKLRNHYLTVVINAFRSCSAFGKVSVFPDLTQVTLAVEKNRKHLDNQKGLGNPL